LSVDADNQITLNLTNSLPVQAAFLSWGLPLDSTFGGDAFIVTRDDQQVPYIGALVKRGDPSLVEYNFFLSGESKFYKINLSDFYDMSQPGRYSIQFVAAAHDFASDMDVQNLPRTRQTFVPSEVIISNTIIIQTQVPMHKVERVGAYDCTTAQLNTIKSAYSAELGMAKSALAEALKKQTTDYTTWFGTFSEGRWQKVYNDYNRINSNTIIAYKCDAGEPNVYAYVYPTDKAHNIYFCGAFWSSGRIGGYDTQAGTILHELSHFDDIAGTDDIIYGTTGCKNLAKSNPNSAVLNADSHEYFAEYLFP